MRYKIYYLLLLGALMGACKKDNYPSPSATFSGRIVYNGEAIGVSQQDVYFELWEPGWDKKLPINVSVNQDGSFSSMLFPATYKLIIPAAQGPFRSKEDGSTHSETPWLKARGELGPLENCENIIDKNLMKQYYSSLINVEEK